MCVSHGDTQSCVGAGFCVALCAAPNWSFPPADLFLIVAFFVVER